MTTLDEIQQAAEGARQGAPVHVRHRLIVAGLTSGHGRKPVEMVNWIQGASLDAGMVAGQVTLNDFAQALADAEIISPAAVLAMVRALRVVIDFRETDAAVNDMLHDWAEFDAAMAEMEKL